MAARLVSMDEVAKHNTEKDCWVVIHNKVLNLGPFLGDHPGGARIISKNAGRDGTSAFEAIHSKDVLKSLPAELVIGELDTKSVRAEHSAPAGGAASDPTLSEVKSIAKPSIDQMLNVFDMECVAQTAMKREGWDYYASAADDEITLRENRAAFQRIWMRPRVLVNVRDIDMSCTMFGSRSPLPLYISATALGKLAHPEGEVPITRACHSTGIIQMCPTLGSCSLDELLAAKRGTQVQWFQLYVNSNRTLTQQLIQKAEKGGCTTLCITVDAPQLGRRERDMRNKMVSGMSDAQKKSGDVGRASQGVAQALTSFIDPSLSWSDLPWFFAQTKMKIVLKGVQCGEDAVLAYKAGCAGIIVSNHGGRQLDFARSGIEALNEIMIALRAAGADTSKFEVIMDGGVRRGTDIWKALALGARGVGIGRPALHGLAAYGQEGVEKVIEIFRSELRMCMSLMGTPAIDSIRPSMLDIRSLHDHHSPMPRDHLALSNYNPLPLPLQRSRL